MRLKGYTDGHVKLQMRNKDNDILFEDNMTQEEYFKKFFYYIVTKPTLKERLFGRYIDET